MVRFFKQDEIDDQIYQDGVKAGEKKAAANSLRYIQAGLREGREQGRADYAKAERERIQRLQNLKGTMAKVTAHNDSIAQADRTRRREDDIGRRYGRTLSALEKSEAAHPCGTCGGPALPGSRVTIGYSLEHEFQVRICTFCDAERITNLHNPDLIRAITAAPDDISDADLVEAARGRIIAAADTKGFHPMAVITDTGEVKRNVAKLRNQRSVKSAERWAHIAPEVRRKIINDARWKRVAKEAHPHRSGKGCFYCGVSRSISWVDFQSDGKHYGKCDGCKFIQPRMNEVGTMLKRVLSLRSIPPLDDFTVLRPWAWSPVAQERPTGTEKSWEYIRNNGADYAALRAYVEKHFPTTCPWVTRQRGRVFRRLESNQDGAYYPGKYTWTESGELLRGA